MSNTNAVSMGGSGNQLAQNLTSLAHSVNIPRGLAAMLLAYRLQRYASQRVIDAGELLLALKAWMRANPKQFTATCVGITVSILGCATPAILGAIGFSATGPVLGSIAAGWQASIGSVTAGSFFAFLQSAAMGGAAMGLFNVIGALGVVVLFGVGASMDLVRQKAVGVAEIVGENFVKAGEVMKVGILRAGEAVAVKAVRVGMKVEGWWGKMMGKMKGE